MIGGIVAMKNKTRAKVRLWIVVGLMLLAMTLYVLSLDDSDPQAVPDGIEEVQHGD